MKRKTNGKYLDINTTSCPLPILYYRSATKYSHVPLSVKRNVPEGEYLSLMELGEILSELSYHSPHEEGVKSIIKPRELHRFVVKTGKLNLIAVDTGNHKLITQLIFLSHFLASVWKAILFLYMADPTQPLPTYEEVVICTEETAVEEVKLIIII